MQLLLDFLPVIAFFVAYKLAGIYHATVVIMIAAPLIVGGTWLLTRKLRSLQVLSGALVIVFGGITLLLHDSAFIMWKPTVLNWLFAAAFLGSTWRMFGGRPLVQRLMQADGGELTLDDALWRQLNWLWIAFFVAMGALNLYVFKTYSEAAWVNFKLWGMLGLTLVFALLQGVWIAAKARPAGGGTA